MRISAIIFALGLCAYATVGQAQTDTLPLQGRQEVAQSETTIANACHSYTLRKTIAPAVLLVSGGVVRHFDNDVKQFRDDYLFEFDNKADDFLQFTPGVLMYGLRAFGVEGHSQTWGQMVAATAFSTLITTGITAGMKNTWGRTRPYREWYHNSFPSGHTISAFTQATLLHREYGELSPWFGIGGYTVAGAVGVSRILNRYHWASDVLAGAGLGLLSGNLGYGLADCLFGNLRRGTPSYRGRNPSFLGVNAVVVAAGNNIGQLKATASYPEFGTPEKQFVRFNHRFGIGYTIEGAYFLLPYVGLGCETALHLNYFELDEGQFFTATNPYASLYSGFTSGGHTTTYLLLPGVYAAVPLGSRWLLGAKVLYGPAETQTFNVIADIPTADGNTIPWKFLYDWFDYGAAFKAGLHTRYLLTNYVELKAEIDYSHARTGFTFFGFEPTEGGVQNLTLQMGMAVSL